ncbi:MAG: hypothetical protein QOJ83_2691, partial [Frankiales bacterium]|nr:hypothetical protein [Frankiales bacterium]
MHTPPGRPASWRTGLIEVERLESQDAAELEGFLGAPGLAGEPATQQGDTAVALLLGAVGCAQLGAVPRGRPSPVAVPEVVAVAYRRGPAAAPPVDGAHVGEWVTSW